jgi:hypothetical protein
LLVLSFLIYGSGQAEQSGDDQTNKTGEVQGSVIEATSNQPVHRALVTLRKVENLGVGTYTDATGEFRFHDVDPGTYTVLAEHDGFVPDPKAERTSVTVAAGVLNEVSTLKLNRTGAVSGHVTDSGGEPITGANLQLQPWKVKKYRPSGISYGGTTDDRGSYRVYNIPPEKYKLAVTYSPRRGEPPVKMQVEKDKSKDASVETYGTTYYPGTLDSGQAVAIQVDAGADLQGIDIGLLRTKAIRITGRVTGPDGALAGPLVIVVLASVGGGQFV